jgi:TPP-dependent pyruvate/acetoin dehydrogenase alpha subunit
MFDPELYREKAEVETWKQRDPIPLLERRLRDEGLLDDATREAIEREVAEELARAEAFAESAPWEPVEDLTRFVHTEAR